MRSGIGEVVRPGNQDPIAIIQARLGSTRLPGKALLSICGTTILDLVVEKALAAGLFSKVIVATTNRGEDRLIGHHLESYGDRISVFCGNAENVLLRFVEVLNLYPAQTVVRLTGDNPWLDLGILRQTVALHRTRGHGYTAVSGAPVGTTGEVIEARHLYSSLEQTQDPSHLEHVTTYIKAHPQVFDVGWLQSPVAESGVRLTVDAAEDFILSEKIMSALGTGLETDISAVLSYLAAHPELADINAHVEQKTR